MKATSKDLRFHTKEILDAAVRGEEVIITYHGKPYVKIVPIEQKVDTQLKTDFCGMWEDREDMVDVTAYVRSLRKGREF